MDKNLDECQRELMEQKEKYMRRRHYKWIVVIGFMFLCSISIIFFGKMYQFATNSLYDREPMEDLMNSLIGKRVISDAITDELMITAYDYNSQKGRLFSKSFAKRNPELLNVKFSLATGSSSAAPIFFEPQIIKNGYGQKSLLIDGGMIGNNPALLSYSLSKNINKEK